jgi:hypothetical protein
MLIREIELDDAESFVNLIKKVESESKFMLFESGERLNSFKYASFKHYLRS